MPEAFASWSGGKDSCLACHRAIAQGAQMRYLVNTVTGDGQRSCSHGISAGVIRLQAQAIGIPLLQIPTTWDSYEAEFKKALQGLKEEGVEVGIFGDIDFNEHRAWVERVCKSASMTARLPLWGESQDGVLRDFIGAGFKSVVVAARADLFDDKILGREVDLGFIEYLEELGETKPVTPCGEAGEYHTLVLDGPLFQKRVEITKAEKVLRDERWFLEISGIALEAR
ncbi:MAG: diphthine--ammonia ligase [Chloroflexota bacterium]